MKIGKLLDMMSEEYLRSEVTFGFELEAVWEEDDQGEFDMGGYLTGFWGGGEWKHDITVHASGNNQADHPFEYASGILKFTPGVVSKFKKFLIDLPKLHIYTNESCSLHTHVSLPRIMDDDIMWVEMQMASSPSFVKNVLTNFGRYQSEQYADPSYMNKILESLQSYAGAYKEASDDRELMSMVAADPHRKKYRCFSKAVSWAVQDSMPIKPDTNSDTWRLHTKRGMIATKLDRAARFLGNKLVDEKYSIVRMHPQGTLEWRGPRSFLDTKEKTDVDEYIDLLFKYVDFVRRAQFLKTIRIGGVEVPREPILGDAKAGRFAAGYNRPIITPKPTIFSRFDNDQMGQTEMIDVLKVAPWLKKQDFAYMHARLSDNNSLVIRNVDWKNGDLLEGMVQYARFYKGKVHEGVTVWNFEAASDHHIVSYGATWVVAPRTIAEQINISKVDKLRNTIVDNWVKGRLLIIPETNTEKQIKKLLDEAGVAYESHFDPIGDPPTIAKYKGRVIGELMETEEIGSQRANAVLREIGSFWYSEEADNEGRIGKKFLDATAEDTPEISGRIEDIRI